MSLFRSQFKSFTRLFSSRLEHLLSLPDSSDKFQSVLEFLNNQPEKNIILNDTETAKTLYDCVIKSGSFPHFKQLNTNFQQQFQLSPTQFEHLLTNCEMSKDYEFAIALLQQAKPYLQINHFHLNKMLSCVLETLDMESASPYQPIQYSVPFQSNFSKSYELLGKALACFKEFETDLDIDSIKMIVGHCIQMGNFNAATKFFNEFYQLKAFNEEDDLFKDLINYFCYKVYDSPELFYKVNVQSCLNFLRTLKQIPTQSVEMISFLLIENYDLNSLKEFINFAKMDNSIWKSINPAKLIDCALKHRDYGSCIEFLLKLMDADVKISTDLYSRIFDSIVEFDPYSKHDEEWRFGKLIEFMNSLKRNALYFSTSKEIHEAITRTCTKHYPPEFFLSYIAAY